MADSVIEWLDKQEHLPTELRDFHDQKLFFKWIVWDRMEASKQKQSRIQRLMGDAFEGINFINLQVAVIDYVLWYLGMHGYRLVKSRKPLPFYDLRETMRAYDNELLEQQTASLKQMMDEEQSDGK